MGWCFSQAERVRWESIHWPWLVMPAPNWGRRQCLHRTHWPRLQLSASPPGWRFFDSWCGGSRRDLPPVPSRKPSAARTTRSRHTSPFWRVLAWCEGAVRAALSFTEPTPQVYAPSSNSLSLIVATGVPNYVGSRPSPPTQSTPAIRRPRKKSEAENDGRHDRGKAIQCLVSLYGQLGSLHHGRGHPEQAWEGEISCLQRRQPAQARSKSIHDPTFTEPRIRDAWVSFQVVE